MARWVYLLFFILIVEIYSYQAFRTAFDNKLFSRIYLLVSLGIFIFLLISTLSFNQRAGLNHFSMIVIAIFLMVYIPKTLFSVFLMVEDVIRLVWGILRYFAGSGQEVTFLPERRQFISRALLVLASVPVASMVYGIWRGRYDYRVTKTKVYFDDLPDDFDGFTILQISDTHCGSFDNREKIRYGIDLISQQKFDMMVFTGDLINTRAEEMDDWLEMFASIPIPEFGKFSILGNHDYGDYLKWPTEEDRLNNQKAIRDVYPKIGFQLLRNENKIIRKGNSTIRLVGVENWGKGGFHKLGDLKKATQNVGQDEFKILLSHDPSHWDMKVQNNPFNYHLTLSGHTHGMQFGIEIPGFKWSPVKYRYPHWAGLYENKGRYLYVNRGFGFLAFPGRVGIWPEISLLELKKKV